ncbi:hypothetical protein J2045_003327 [Peteryoungia aggregata LMG 23059]|uniref:Phage tail tape measure protein domain-containing protein n=1 Tax=Peteryoungia aggregata LMG 23059 TaxID=1368425 RepID=A0ABU0GA93_9HYPH|nr:phage tail tape measure protein [Peteryoungia aggregata]MDQ0422279.1 hypothetical protein [Peteryoungia aggregata LMG 23059]
MTSRVASLRLQLIDSVSAPSKNAAGALKGLDAVISKLGKGASPEVKRLVKQLEYLKKKSGAIDDFTGTSKGLKEVGLALKAARSEVSRLEAALKATTNPTKKMQQDLLKAKAAVKNANDAFNMQKQSVSAAERALRSYSVNGAANIASSQQKIRQQVAQTIREIRKLNQEQKVVNPRRPASPATPSGSVSAGPGVGTAIGGGYVANEGKNLAQRSFFEAVNFNEAAAYQAALGKFNKTDRATLNRQAEEIGGDTRFSNVDVVRAQTSILQGGIRDPKTIMDLTGKVTDYALAMGVTLEEAAETVKGSALSKRVNLSDADAIGKFVDNLVWMAKNGGMSDEDVRQFMKFGGASTTGAGLPDANAAAIGMILRRSGVRGDEAGVFARSMSGKLVAPTNKGRNALYAMGLDYNDFVSQDDAMNTTGIGKMFQNEFGKSIPAEVMAQIQDVLDNGTFVGQDGEEYSVASDSGQFNEALSSLLVPLLEKDGKVSGLDRKALSKSLGDFWKNSVDSVDTLGLFDAIMKSNPSLAQLNAFFTERQGGRANMIAQQYGLYQEMVGLMNNTPGGIAKQIGTDANSELYGDWTKLVGTFETTLTRIGQDFESMTRPVINFTNDMLDGFLELEQSTRQLIVAFGAAAATFAGFAAIRGLAGMFGGGAAGAAAGGVAGAAGATVKGVAGGFLTRNLLTGSVAAQALLWKEAITQLSAGYANDEKQGAPRQYDQGEAQNRANYQRQFGGIAFEGGRHRVGLGAAPAPGQASPYGEYTSLKSGGDTQVNTQVESPVSIQLHGVGMDQMIQIIRTTTSQAFSEMAGKLQGALSQQLSRSSQTNFGGVKPYGD